MTVFGRFAVGFCSFARSRAKLNGLFSAHQCSLPDTINVSERNKGFVRGFSAVPNGDAVEVDISRLESENQGRCFVFYLGYN